MKAGIAVIRDKFVTSDGHLVLDVDYWQSEADWQASPNAPRASHDHVWKLKPGAVLQANDGNLGANIHEVFEGSFENGSGVIANATAAHKRGTDDQHGWLSHPHVQALQVIPRV